MRKNVAGTRRSASMSSRSGVRTGYGPSSKLSATSLTSPGRVGGGRSCKKRSMRAVSVGVLVDDGRSRLHAGVQRDSIESVTDQYDGGDEEQPAQAARHLTADASRCSPL